jgi:hypothetical protein
MAFLLPFSFHVLGFAFYDCPQFTPIPNSLAFQIFDLRSQDHYSKTELLINNPLHWRQLSVKEYLGAHIVLDNNHPNSNDNLDNQEVDNLAKFCSLQSI